MTFNPSITFDKMLELAVSKEEESTKDLEQLETTVHKETIEIPSDKEEISTLIKPSSGDRFTRDGVDLLHSTALSSLDFHKSIQNSHRAEEYARDYSRMMEKLNKKWQEKEMARPMVPTTFSEPISTGNTKASMTKKTGRRFTGHEAAEQEEAIKRRTKRRQSIERARREKYAELHASDKGEWDELYGVSMSEQDSNVEYLGTTTENPINNQENHLTTTPPHPSKSSLLSSPKSSTDSDLPDLDDPSIREKFSQSQAARLYSLSQNVNPEEIISSSRGITTRKSRGVHKNSRAQLEWESQQRAEEASREQDRKSASRKKEAQKAKPRKEDVSQLIGDFSELNSSQ